VTVNHRIERLTPRDVPDNVALANAVGWLDVESDWRVLHEAAVVLGIHENRRLIAQGALGAYGTAGTIAKMTIAPDFQGKRIGQRLLDALLEEAARQSVGVLGLVATDLGRPLYLKRSFSCVGEVITLTGTPQVPPAIPSATALTNPDVAVSAEQRWISCTRAPLVHARFREAIAAFFSSGPDGGASGYAMATRQGLQSLVGPVIASSEEDARSLTSAILRAVPGPARIDVPEEQHSFRDWLQSLGLQEQGVRVEMALGTERLPWQVPQRFALAAQAWG
jgi:GNAT superfamily N-acetyltransferase